MPQRIGSRLVYGLGERGSGFKVRSRDGVQDFEKIRKQCLAKAVLFEDDEFPAIDASVGMPHSGPIRWKRAADLVSSGKRAKFISGGANRFDVNQGDMGNCWFLAAVADLTLDEKCFSFVVPDDNTFGNEYCGAFHFRFWQSGVWVEVVIDDRLPCDNKGELMFMRSETSFEFWSALLEKAYAKLYRSYYALNGGFTFEALQDFTGGFTEIYSLDKLDKYQLDEDKLYELMVRIRDRSSFMGSSAKANPNIKEEILPNGLVKGHAYSITDVKAVAIKAGGNVRLLRLRNPWGTDEEWTGDWSDSSETWKLVAGEERERLGVVFHADGESWISLEDYLENFARLEICHLNPSTKEGWRGDPTTPLWDSHLMFGRWTAGVTAGGNYKNTKTFASNPQYVITVAPPEKVDKHSGTVVISLMKSDNRRDETTKVTDVCFKVWAVPDTKGIPIPLDKAYLTANPPIKTYTPAKGPREYTTRFKFTPGKYVVIPSTYNANEEGEFLLRVFTEGRSTFKMYDNEIGVTEQEVDIKDDSEDERRKEEQARRTFHRTAGKDGEIDWWELKMALDKNFRDMFKYDGFAFSEDSCRSMVALVDADGSGKLNFFEFWKLWCEIMMWKKIFKEHDVNQTNTLGSLKSPELRTALLSAGYKVNASTLSAIVRRYGDRNGEIWLDKFVMAAVKLRAMIELFNRRAVRDPEQDEQIARLNIDEWLEDTIYT